jgi:hypothetical protein
MNMIYLEEKIRLSDFLSTKLYIIENRLTYWDTREGTSMSTVAHTCNPSTWEKETGGPQDPGQPGLHSETLSALSIPPHLTPPHCQKKKRKVVKTTQKILFSWDFPWNIPQNKL